MDNENEIWDEFKWEEFMREQDKKVDRYMELFYRYLDHPDRDEMIAREMGWNWLLGDDPAHDGEGMEMGEEDEMEEGEEWKSESGMTDQETDFRRYNRLPAYEKAKAFALRAMKIVDKLPESKKGDSAVVDFVSNAMIASAKIAGGSGIGEEIEELGGNIAYCKRGLQAANLSIAALHEMKAKGILTGEGYLEFMKELIEVRNLIAIHVLELREKFRRGV
jgi:hypothetical protein